MTPDIDSLQSSLARAFSVWGGDRSGHRPAGDIYLGLETRTVPAEYRWDGLRRGAVRSHPQVVFQATLTGWGAFEQGGRKWTVGPGSAFFAVFPSEHVYYLPKESPGWTFFWFTFTHPYLVARLEAQTKLHAPVFSLPAGSALMAQSRMLFERTCHQRFEDTFSEEGAWLEWMLAFERHLHELAHPRGQREAMLELAREYTLGNLSRSFGIEELAAKQELSRSHFSHRFRAATGLAPAAYILEVRLAEVRRLLRETSLPLKDIAGQTGFADANHLCKAFRRQFHMSPGGYRQQVR